MARHINDQERSALKNDVVVDLTDLTPNHADIESALKLTEFFGIVDYLESAIRSELPMTTEDRAQLADYVRRSYRRPPGRTKWSRINNPGEADKVRRAAAIATNLKQRWRAEGQKWRINDKACQLAAEHEGVDVDTVRNFLNRSKRPRKPYQRKTNYRT